MTEVGKRLKVLREGAMLSQTRMAEELGSTQSSINRYENGQSAPPVSLFRAYADYFDVSMDYIFARADKPQGKLYEYKPKVTPINDQMKQFVDMCFDSDSPVSEKMKETLLQLMAGENDT